MNTSSVISQLTDWFLPRRRSLTTFIKAERRRKKNGEKPLRFDDFTVLLLTFFSIKLLFLGQTRDLWYLSSQTDFCPTAAAAWSCLLKQSGNTKRTVRNDYVLMIFQFFYSPFLQLNCYFWGERVICDISAHRLIFAPPPPPPDRVY